MPSSKSPLQRRLDRIAIVSVMLAVGTLVWARVTPVRPPVTATDDSGADGAFVARPAAPISLAGAEFEGDADSPIVVLAFIDFQAMLSGIFAVQTLPALENVYVHSGRVRFAVKHFPVRTHAFAFTAARHAACAARQGRFWRVHDYLFDNQGSLSNPDPRTWPRSLGIDIALLSECLTDRSIDEDIRASIRTGEGLGLSIVPSYFVGRPENGALVVTDAFAGSVTFGQFKTAIDRLLAERHD